jgi:hypothetical protein
VPQIVAAPFDKQVERTSAAKAIASKTNRGAVERMDFDIAKIRGTNEYERSNSTYWFISNIRVFVPLHTKQTINAQFLEKARFKAIGYENNNSNNYWLISNCVYIPLHTKYTIRSMYQSNARKTKLKRSGDNSMYCFNKFTQMKLNTIKPYG